MRLDMRGKESFVYSVFCFSSELNGLAGCPCYLTGMSWLIGFLIKAFRTSTWPLISDSSPKQEHTPSSSPSLSSMLLIYLRRLATGATSQSTVILRPTQNTSYTPSLNILRIGAKMRTGMVISFLHSWKLSRSFWMTGKPSSGRGSSVFR